MNLRQSYLGMIKQRLATRFGKEGRRIKALYVNCARFLLRPVLRAESVELRRSLSNCDAGGVSPETIQHSALCASTGPAEKCWCKTATSCAG